MIHAMTLINDPREETIMMIDRTKTTAGKAIGINPTFAMGHSIHAENSSEVSHPLIPPPELLYLGNLPPSETQ